MDTLLTPDRLVGIAVDLVNTRTAEPERLTSVAALHAFLVAHDEPTPIDVDERDLAEVRAVRERLRPVFGASAPDAARLLNDLLREYAVRPYLTEHGETPWHLHVSQPDARWAEWLAAGAALALAGFAAGHGFGALSVCAAGDCERVFVNAAAKRPRRFCTPTCSSRTRVASYRARRASGGAA
ncbi:CGNR zinc finger domain-containing protein [Kribbella sp. NPDC056951]|uniref:CGNR zinc finger domain-containing protein n=1 Tax=Kribbella sp. NPDC056951 TaxID=3345978 RepID=UPI00363C21CA